jgi:hypothetical protein
MEDTTMMMAINCIINNYVYRHRFTPYGELADIIKCSPRDVDKFLEPYDQQGKDNGLPPISTLVINAENNMPGDGYFSYHFSHDTRDKQLIWVEQVKKIDYRKYKDLFGI